MKQKRISLRADQARYLNDRPSLSLAPMVRDALDEAMSGKYDYPTGNTRRNVDVKKTVILVTEKQADFIATSDMNLSHFVDEVVQKRMDLERKLNELDEE